MTILFFLKPNLGMPPSGVPGGAPKRKRKEYRKWLIAERKRRQEEEELVLYLLFGEI